MTVENYRAYQIAKIVQYSYVPRWHDDDRSSHFKACLEQLESRDKKPTNAECNLLSRFIDLFHKKVDAQYSRQKFK